MLSPLNTVYIQLVGIGAIIFCSLSYYRVQLGRSVGTSSNAVLLTEWIMKEPAREFRNTILLEYHRLSKIAGINLVIHGHGRFGVLGDVVSTKKTR